MNVTQLREDLIKPVLNKLNMYSIDAENLLVGTCCAESLCGEYIKQINGPARGIFQMEVNTALDVFNNYIKRKQSYYSIIKSIMINQDDLSAENIEYNLMYNLAFQVAMCRIHYYRVSEKIPSTFEGYAYYWKKYYNTIYGKGTEKEFLEKWKRFEKIKK